MGQLQALCCEDMGLKKGSWTPEEDLKLIAYINKHGYGNWRALPNHAGLLRCGKSCRLRWTNYLRPDIKRGNFTLEEEQKIIQLHRILGNRWSTIASHLPGRTDNEIKNVWNTHLRKCLLKIGVDPVTYASTPYSPHPHHIDEFKSQTAARKTVAKDASNTTTAPSYETPHTITPAHDETPSLCLDYTTLLPCSYIDSPNFIMAEYDEAIIYNDFKPLASQDTRRSISFFNNMNNEGNHFSVEQLLELEDDSTMAMVDGYFHEMWSPVNLEEAGMPWSTA